MDLEFGDCTPARAPRAPQHETPTPVRRPAGTSRVPGPPGAEANNSELKVYVQRQRLAWCQLGFTWLRVRASGLGCKLCYRAWVGTNQGTLSGENPLAQKVCGISARSDMVRMTCQKKVRVHQLRIHSNSLIHRLSAQMAAKDVAKMSVMIRSQAPSEVQLQGVLAAVRAGARKVPGMEGTKFNKVVWCLAEAVRNELRARLRKAASIAIHVDKREAKLLVRCTASSERLDQTSGIIGLC
jgi:hypothetical protein